MNTDYLSHTIFQVSLFPDPLYHLSSSSLPSLLWAVKYTTNVENLNEVSLCPSCIIGAINPRVPVVRHQLGGV